MSMLALVTMMFSQAERSDHFGRGNHEEHFCEIILNLNQLFRICFEIISYLKF